MSDGLTPHETRRSPWIEETYHKLEEERGRDIAKRFEKVTELNRIKGTQINYLLAAVYDLSSTNPELVDLTDELTRVFRDEIVNTMEWDKKSNENKHDTVNKLSRLASQVLYKLSPEEYLGENV